MTFLLPKIIERMNNIYQDMTLNEPLKLLVQMLKILGLGIWGTVNLTVNICKLAFMLAFLIIASPIILVVSL